MNCSLCGRIALLFSALLLTSHASALNLIHSERSLYRQVLVYEEGGTRLLCFTRNCAIGRQSSIEIKHPDRLLFDYTHMMMGALFMAPPPKNILIVGLGGGSLPRALATALPDAHIDVVEIDPAVVRVARRYFGFVPGAALQVYEEDGRAYVKRAVRAGKRYELIMLDAYDHEYIPEHMLTREFLLEVRALLAPAGVVAANTFSSSRLYDNESVTYQAVFGTFYSLKGSNRVIMARNGALPEIAAIQQAANGDEALLRRFDVDAVQIARRFSTAVDWQPDARVLTDQYSPANLLNSAR
jgi:spermidine synthase